MSNIGEKIRNRRTELEMTQQELAERMGYKHKSSINKIELGMTEVTIDQAELFADVLDVPRGVCNHVMARQMRKKTPHSDTLKAKHPFIR